MINRNEATRSSNHEESDFAFDFQFAFCIFINRFFRSHAMIFSTCITHGSRFVQKWKIVEIDHANANGLTFDCILRYQTDLFKAKYTHFFFNVIVKKNSFILMEYKLCRGVNWILRWNFTMKTCTFETRGSSRFRLHQIQM